MPQLGMSFSQRDSSQGQFVNSLQSILRNSEPEDTVYLFDWVDIKWSRVCILYEATAYRDINEIIGFKWIDKDGYLFSEQYVIFLDGNVVVMHFPLPAPYFFVGSVKSGRCIDQDKAIFKVESVQSATSNKVRKYLALQD